MSAYYLLLGFLGIIAIYLNLSLLMGIVRDSRMRKLFHIQIGGQAVTDLSVGIITAYFNLGTLLQNGELIGGGTGCTIYGFGIVTTCQATVFSLALIAHNRKKSIIFNDKTHVSTKQALLYYLGIVWGSTLIATSYLLVVTRSRMACSGSFCNPVWNLPAMIPTIFLIGVPIGYICSVYFRIYRKLSVTAKAMKAHKIGSGFGHRTTELMFLMSGTILVMWLPLYIHFVFNFTTLVTGSKSSFQEAIEKLLGVSSIMSSICSPLVYSFKNQSLRYTIVYAFFPVAWKNDAMDSLTRIEELRVMNEALEVTRLESVKDEGKNNVWNPHFYPKRPSMSSGIQSSAKVTVYERPESFDGSV